MSDLKQLTLRPVAGEVMVAGRDEQIVLPDDCSFTSTVLADGTRRYVIGEAVQGDQFTELRAYAEKLEGEIVELKKPAPESELEALIQSLSITQQQEAGRLIFSRAVSRIPKNSGLYGWAQKWEDADAAINELEALAESDAEFEIVLAFNLYWKIGFRNALLWMCWHLVTSAKAFGDAGEETTQIADMKGVLNYKENK